MKKAAESLDLTEGLGEALTKVCGCLPLRGPVSAGRLPLFRWRKTTPKGETELSIGPSAGWAIVTLAALALKAVGATSFLAIVWRGLRR